MSGEADSMMELEVEEKSEMNLLKEGDGQVEGEKEAFWLFIILGAGFLFPWNVVITAVDYFTCIYPSSSVEFLFAATYTVPNACTIVLVAVLGPLAPTWPLLLGFLVFLLVLATLALLSLLPAGAVTWAVLLVGALGLADAVVQATLYGLAGVVGHPARSSQAVQIGTATAGTVVSLLRITTKLLFEQTRAGLLRSALLYFSLAALYMLLCLGALTRLRRLTPRPPPASAPTPSLPRVISTIRTDLFVVGFNFFVTLACFPGLMAGIPNEALGNWYPVLLITAFNVLDLCGRLLPSLRWFVRFTHTQG